MAYKPGDLILAFGGINDPGVRIWTYKTTDGSTAVEAADYFSDALYRGMRVGDLVYIVEVDSGTVTSAAFHVVMTVDSDGADLSDATAITVTNT